MIKTKHFCKIPRNWVKQKPTHFFKTLREGSTTSKEQTEPKFSAKIRPKAKIRFRLGQNRNPIYKFRFRSCRNRNLIMYFGFNRKFRPKSLKKKKEANGSQTGRNSLNFYAINTVIFLLLYFLKDLIHWAHFQIFNEKDKY